MQKLPTTASLRSDHGCCCCKSIPFDFLFRIKLLLLLLLHSVRIRKNCNFYAILYLFSKVLGAMNKHFSNAFLLYQQNPDKTVTVVPSNEGSHTYDFAGLLLLGYKPRLAWEHCHAVGCRGLLWKTVGRFPALSELTWPDTWLSGTLWQAPYPSGLRGSCPLCWSRQIASIAAALKIAQHWAEVWMRCLPGAPPNPWFPAHAGAKSFHVPSVWQIEIPVWTYL